MKMNTQNLIDTLTDATDGDLQAMLYALEDGEYLAQIGADQATVEDAYTMIKKSQP